MGFVLAEVKQNVYIQHSRTDNFAPVEITANLLPHCRLEIRENGEHFSSDFVKTHWKNISLFGWSLGAYFSLVAYQDIPFHKCLFLSPILDMEQLIKKMMKWFEVSEALLKEKREIPTLMGEALSWSYYTYVKEHPITQWDNKTSILYGSNDNLTERSVVDDFVKRFHCELEVIEKGEHFFQTKEQLEILARWLENK